MAGSLYEFRKCLTPSAMSQTKPTKVLSVFTQTFGWLTVFPLKVPFPRYAISKNSCHSNEFLSCFQCQVFRPIPFLSAINSTQDLFATFTGMIHPKPLHIDFASRKFRSESFVSKTPRNRFPRVCFPKNYNLHHFKFRVNRYLYTIILVITIFDFLLRSNQTLHSITL